jgi:S-adenosylmethionine/arginine decarboxylase-like enzyme
MEKKKEENSLVYQASEFGTQIDARLSVKEYVSQEKIDSFLLRALREDKFGILGRLTESTSLCYSSLALLSESHGLLQKQKVPSLCRFQNHSIFYGVNRETIKDNSRLLEIVQNCLPKDKNLKFVPYKFNPQGFSFIALLNGTSITGHFYPEFTSSTLNIDGIDNPKQIKDIFYSFCEGLRPKRLSNFSTEFISKAKELLLSLYTCRKKDDGKTTLNSLVDALGLDINRDVNVIANRDVYVGK